MSMGAIQQLEHIPYALTALSYLFRDVYWLRGMAICGCALWITLGLIDESGIRYSRVFWNSAFLLVNVTMMVLLFYERRRVDLSASDRELHNTVFFNLTPVEFVKLLGMARDHQPPEGTELLHEGTAPRELHLLCGAVATVLHQGRPIAELRDGQWAGEMAFMTGNAASATVRVLVPGRTLTWQVDALHALLARNPSMRFAMQGLFGQAISHKLARAGSVIGQATDAIRRAREESGAHPQPSTAPAADAAGAGGRPDGEKRPLKE